MKLARQLVEAGLWVESDEGTGWIFHQWDERNPTKEDVEERRAIDRERQREWRAEQREKRRKAALSRGDNSPSHGVTDDVTPSVTNDTTQHSHAVSHGVRHDPPDPTRPDPTHVVVPNGTTTPEKILPRKRGQRLEPGWIPSEETRILMAEQCPGIDLRAEHAKFTDYWTAKTGRDATKLDWDATWRNWIRNAKPTKPANGKPRNQAQTDDMFSAAMERAIAADQRRAVNQ
jgi:hypothetical protein